MKAIVSVFGADKRGIIAKISDALWKMGINIEDISQTIMQNFFTMTMLVDLSEATLSFDEIAANLTECGKEIGVDTRIQSEAIFYAMHRI